MSFWNKTLRPEYYSRLTASDMSMKAGILFTLDGLFAPMFRRYCSCWGYPVIEIQMGRTKVRLHRPTWLEVLAFVLFLVAFCTTVFRFYR